jgi:hypothetical protein
VDYLWDWPVVSGALAVLVAMRSSTRHVVTIGTSGSIAGFSVDTTPDIGSIDVGSSHGVTIASIWSRSSGDFELWLTGGFDQGYVHSVTVETGSGAIRTYDTASADEYQNQSGALTFWRWGDGTDRVWATTDSAEEHYVLIRY